MATLRCLVLGHKLIVNERTKHALWYFNFLFIAFIFSFHFFFLFLVLPIYGPRLRLCTSWLQRTFKNLDHVQWPWSRINTQQVSSGHRHNKLLRKSSGRTQECVINKKVTGKLKRIGFFGFLFNFPEVNFNSLLICYLSYLKWDQF